MADNFTGLSSTGLVTHTFRATDIGGGIIVPWKIISEIKPGENVIGGVVGPHAAPATSILTRPNNATAYSSGQLVANNTVAASIVVPSFVAARQGADTLWKSGRIKRMKLFTDRTLAAGSMAAIAMTLRLWQAAPTYTNGDGGTYVLSSTAAALKNYLGRFTITAWEQWTNGAYTVAAPDVGDGIIFPAGLASGLVYWDLMIGSSFTPTAQQTFTIIPEIEQK